MGLDMYLYLEDKETREHIEFSYYRKFNALQGYFVREHNLDNCGRILITESIRKDVYQILNEIRFNREKGPELLPTFPGPFFGIYDYDRMYYTYIDQAATDFYHVQFINYNKYNLYFTSNW